MEETVSPAAFFICLQVFGVTQQMQNVAGKHRLVAYQTHTTGLDKRLIDLAKILHIPARQDCRACHGRFHRILSALSMNRFSHESDLGKPQVKSHFPDGIAQIRCPVVGRIGSRELREMTRRSLDRAAS